MLYAVVIFCEKNSTESSIVSYSELHTTILYQQTATST